MHNSNLADIFFHFPVLYYTELESPILPCIQLIIWKVPNV